MWQRGHLDQVFELGAHNLGTADRTPDGCFVNDRPQVRRFVVCQQLLACDAHHHSLIHFFF